MIVLEKYKHVAIQYHAEMKYHNYMMDNFVFDDTEHGEKEYIKHLKQFNFFSDKLKEMNALDFYGVTYYPSSPSHGEISPLRFM